MIKKYLSAVLIFSVLSVGFSIVSAIVYAEQIQTDSISLFGKENATIRFTSSVLNKENINSLTFNTVKSEKVLISDKYKKEVHISPNKKYLSVTFEPNEESVLTYVTDVNGKEIVSLHIGSFVSWAPDSSKVLLFLSDSENATGRRIYFLGVDGSYKDSGLPKGTISADISAKDGSIVFSVTNRGTDESNIYILKKGETRKYISLGLDDKNIFAWVRWSSKGDKIAFMKSDLALSSGKQSVYVIDPDPKNPKPEKVSNVIWDYPQIWSPDGTRITFANEGNIWEYNISNKSIKNLTNFYKGTSEHPDYSSDGQTITFTSNISGSKQIWSVRNGKTAQITTDDEEKDYPVTL